MWRNSVVMFLLGIVVVAFCSLSMVIPATAKIEVRLGRPTALFMAPDQMFIEIFKQYEKDHPGVKIKYEPTPFDEYFRKIGLGLSAGTAPDIFLLNEVWRYVENDNLSPAPDKYAQDIRKDFAAATVPPTTYNGQTYGYPLEGGLRIIVYNKDMFKEAGIQIAPGEVMPAKNWEELRIMAQKVTKRSADGRIIQEGFKVPSETSGNVVCSLASFFWSAGGEFYSPEMDRITLDQPATYKALKFWEDLAKKYKVTDPTYDLDTFAQNTCAMFIGGAYYTGHLDRDAPFINYGNFYIPPPAQEAGEGVDTNLEPKFDNQPWMYVLNKASKAEVKEEAWKVMKRLTEDDLAVELAKAGVCLFRQSAIEIAIPQVNEVLRTFLEAQKYVHPRTPKYWRYLVTRFPRQIQQMLLGKKTIFEVVMGAQGEINRDIKAGGEL